METEGANMRRRTLIHIFVFVMAIGCLPGGLLADFNPIERVSVRSNGEEALGASMMPGMAASADGRYVVFVSEATNLVSEDFNSVADVFLHDRQTGHTERVSLRYNDTEANGASGSPSVSSNGRYVVFTSMADNLVTEDNNDAMDVFLRDRTAGTTIRVSVREDGGETNGASYAPMVSSDGQFVVFSSDASNIVSTDTNGVRDIFVYELATGDVERISLQSNGVQGNADSYLPSVSETGRYVAFESDATNLVTDDTNAARDIFFHDRNTGATSRMSKNTADEEAAGDSFGPMVSLDGTVVAFSSEAANLVSDDTNGVTDVFAHVVATGVTERVSLAEDDEQLQAPSSSPSLSEDGRYVFFVTEDDDVVSSDTNGVADVFARDRTSASTTKVSVKFSGAEADGASFAPQVNDSGQYLSFASAATDLVGSDDNNQADIFVINTQCLLAPPGIVIVDQDSDGTDDCADDCALDSAKTSAGVCGCGVVDVDSDGDGTLDCNDECPADASKVLTGSCGCGVADTDGNGNGTADCLDPSILTRPSRAAIELAGLGGNTRQFVIIPTEFQNVRYQVQLGRRGRLVAQAVVARNRIRLPKRFRAGIYQLRYRVLLPGGGFSRFSRVIRFRVQ